MLKAFYFIIRDQVKSEEYHIIFRLLLVSLVIVLSLMHYTTFLVPGVKQLFAAVIALSFVLLKKEYLKYYRPYSGKANSESSGAINTQVQREHNSQFQQ